MTIHVTINTEEKTVIAWINGSSDYPCEWEHVEFDSMDLEYIINSIIK